MIWTQLLAYVTGTVNQELRSRNEYLAAENRILKAQIKGRLFLSKEEKATLAEIAHRLGRKALEEVASTAQPDTYAFLRSVEERRFGAGEPGSLTQGQRANAQSKTRR